MSQPMLPFSRPSISEAAIADVVAVLRSGWITSGAKVVEFETAFAAAVGARHAVAVSSGTAAIDVALDALELKAGDEVIVPSINWVSGPNLVELHGLRTVFADVHPETLQIDLADVERKLSGRTRAIMPVHFAGMPCDLEAIRRLSEPRGIRILEDAAHAAGAGIQGRAVGCGTGSGIAVFSFHPTKNLTTAEGGMAVTDDDAVAARLRLGRFHGIRKDAWRHHGRSGRDRYDVVAPGRKYNLTDIQAALGIHQLRELAAHNAERARLARLYAAALGAAKLARPLAPARPGDVHAWHIYVVLIDPRVRGGRDAVVAGLEARGIGTGLHFPCVHTQSHYRRSHPGVHLGVSEDVGERLLSLPLFPGMADGDVARVAEALAALSGELLP